MAAERSSLPWPRSGSSSQGGRQGGLQEVRLDAALVKMIEKVEKELKEAQRSAGAAGPAAA